MKTLYINGKFLLQRTTGVERFSHGLVRSLDESLVRHPAANRVVLLTPPTAPILSLQVVKQKVCGGVFGSLVAWEQISLPLASRDGTLLCLSGSAPLLVRNIVSTIHDAALYKYPEAYSWQFVAWYRLLFRVLSKKAALLFTVSSNSASELTKYLPGIEFKLVPNSAEHILSNPADINVLALLGITAKQYLLAVGSRNPTKNLSALIEAYSQARSVLKVPLIIVGESNRSVFSSGVPSDEGIPGVIFAGGVSDAALRALYENALAFVFPSLYEGFGIPPLEAMLCGCPVVASHAASIPEVCADAAIYFDPVSVDDIARALKSITSNALLREDLVGKGRKRSVQFNWANSAEILRCHLQEAGLLSNAT